MKAQNGLTASFQHKPDEQGHNYDEDQHSQSHDETQWVNGGPAAKVTIQTRKPRSGPTESVKGTGGIIWSVYEVLIIVSVLATVDGGQVKQCTAVDRVSR